MKHEGEWKSVEANQVYWRVQRLWEKYRSALPARPPEPTPYDQERLEQNTLTEPQQLSSLQRLRQKRRQREARPRSQDEFLAFCDEAISYDIRSSALAWWLQDIQQSRFPQLSRFAIDVLSILAMSDKPERVFSDSRRTISWDRTRIDPDTVEEVECLKDWKRHDVLQIKF